MSVLEIRDLHVRFGQAHILQGVSLNCGPEPLALVGRNGMGKSTLCYSIMGMLNTDQGQILLNGREIRGLRPNRVAKAGVALVPQGRRLFPSLTVHEHLQLVVQSSKAAWNIERVYDIFPRLAERRSNRGGQLSGGEQQMTAIARALLMNPELLIMDEPSEGLAPVIVDHLIDTLRTIAAEGMSILLVEQNLHVATSVAAQVAIMVTGNITTTMPSDVLANDTAAQQRYLGVSSSSQSFSVNE